MSISVQGVLQRRRSPALVKRGWAILTWLSAASRMLYRRQPALLRPAVGVFCDRAGFGGAAECRGARLAAPFIVARLSARILPLPSLGMLKAAVSRLRSFVLRRWRSTRLSIPFVVANSNIPCSFGPFAVV
jgi:hypothetical protein